MASPIGKNGRSTVTGYNPYNRPSGGAQAYKSRAVNNYGAPRTFSPTLNKGNAGTNDNQRPQSLTNFMSALNQFNSTISGFSSNTSYSTSGNTGATDGSYSTAYNTETADYSSASGTGSFGGASSASSMSGLAQGISHDGLDSLDTQFLGRLESNLDDYGKYCSELDFNAEQVNIKLNAEKRKVNATLAKEQANFNSIRTQKQTAEANVTRLASQVEGAAEAETTAKSDLHQCSSQLNQQTKTRDQMDEQLATLNEGYKEICNDVKSKEKAKSSAQDKVTSAKQSVAQSTSAVKSADQAVSNAQSTLNSTPQKLENGSPNPAYQQAQIAFQQAQSQKQQADQSLQEAKQYEQECNENLQKANEELEASQNTKQQSLKKIQETDTKCKDIAQRCEQLQNSVEQQQKSYDKAREVHDDASANHERLNSELEAQQGILTEYEAIESNLNDLKETAEKLEEFDNRLAKIRTDQDNANKNNLSSEEMTAVEQNFLKHANATEGCSASKTRKENLLSCTPEDIARVGNADVWDTSLGGISGGAATAEMFERAGYKKNSDGSFTDPRTGVTMVNVYGNEWHPNTSLAKGMLDENTINLQFPYSSEVIARQKEQQFMSLDGWNADGTPKFKWKK